MVKKYNVTFSLKGNSVLYRANQTMSQVYSLWDDAEQGLILFDEVHIVML